MQKLQRRVFILTFWRFSGWISAKLVLIWSKMHLQDDSLPFFRPTITFYGILARACTEIKILSLYAFRFLKIFYAFPFSIFSFCCSD